MQNGSPGERSDVQWQDAECRRLELPPLSTIMVDLRHLEMWTLKDSRNFEPCISNITSPQAQRRDWPWHQPAPFTRAHVLSGVEPSKQQRQPYRSRADLIATRKLTTAFSPSASTAAVARRDSLTGAGGMENKLHRHHLKVARRPLGPRSLPCNWELCACESVGLRAQFPSRLCGEYKP